ncbi:MAG: DHH family phosphoesterase [Aigarchaeota archaeon]|nr:DHH family phosphoesterase [Aigarchaeota archaeon]
MEAKLQGSSIAGMEKHYEDLLEDAAAASERIASLVQEDKMMIVVSHNDADGLSAAGIMASALYREGARFIARAVHRIEPLFEDIDQGFTDGDCLLLLDSGSGYIDELSHKLRGKEAIILDHHRPSQAETPNGWTHVNPHLREIDGVTELSGSGIAYLVAKHLNEENVSSSPVAVVGALGDTQDKDGKRSLRGLNAKIVDEAVQKGLLTATEDLLLFGRTFKPLHVALATTTTPYIPGLTGREENCVSFLTSLGLKMKDQNRWKVLADLTPEEKKTLYNGLVSYLVSQRASPSVATELIGSVYELTREESWTSLRDAREFSSLLNACGKSDAAWQGISLAMGVRGEVLELAHKTLEDYRVQLAKHMDYILKPGVIEEAYNIAILRGGEAVDEKRISSVATIMSSSDLIPPDKPLIAVAHAGEIAKISARSRRELVAKGLDLGEILSETASKFGGRGGGHNVAAGAEIPSHRLTLFLMELDKRVGEILKEHRGIRSEEQP